MKTELKMNSRKIYPFNCICCSLLLAVLETQAQDPHFSQYFSSPLTINPANTGNSYGKGRLVMNYRNQWQGIGNPYLTGTISYDGEILKDKVGAGNRLALGVMGMYDKTADGGLVSNYAAVSAGYHLWLDAEESSRLSIGFQSSMVNKHLDFSKLTFESQFSSGGFNISVPPNQNFTSGNINYIDFNTGLLFTKNGEKGSVYVGASFYHITRPSETFLGAKDQRLASRFNFSIGGSLDVGEVDRILFSGLLMNQASVTTATIGATYEKFIDSNAEEMCFYLGSWYRYKDAVIPYVGYRLNDIQLGLTYDVTTSGLNLSGTRNRSIELSFLYTIMDKSSQKRFTPWY